MLAEVISIGDELTSGQRLDTNCQWLSERLGELGIRVMYHSTVADDLDANVRVFLEAADRADVVIATGGLGPTADDLTRDALAKVLGTELVLDEAMLEHIRNLFALFSREMPERNRVQALFPEGSRPIFNPAGSAPGIDVEIAREGRDPSRVFALPGVPSEMKQMWAESVAPDLVKLSGGRVIRHRRIKCFGQGESHLEQMLPDLIRRGRRPMVGITASKATITLRITADGVDEAECLASMEPTLATIRDTLGELVFGEEDDELEHAVARLLIERGRTLATVEWGTGGQVAQWLHDVPEIGDAFLGGVVVRSASGAARMFDLDETRVDASRVEHGPLVEAIAQAARRLMPADLVLVTGPVPLFEPSMKKSPKVSYALASAEGTIVRSAPMLGDRSLHVVRSAKQALNMVRLALVRES